MSNVDDDEKDEEDLGGSRAEEATQEETVPMRDHDSLKGTKARLRGRQGGIIGRVPATFYASGTSWTVSPSKH